MEGSHVWRRRIAAPVLAVLIALTGTQIAEARQSPVVVTVNDPAGTRTVTAAQLERWLEIARWSSGGADTTTAKRFLQAQVLQLLVSFAWIEGEARAQGVTVTDAEVTASFEEQKQQSFPKKADFRKFLRQSRQTRADVRERVRLDLLSNGIRDRVVAPAAGSVTEANIDAYIEKNGPIEQPELRYVRLVLTKTRAQAQEARSALERGATWKQVARRYSLDESSARRGGRLPGLPEGELDRPLDRAVFRARRGRLIGPIKSEYGYYVVKVIRIRPAFALPAKEGREMIREMLVSEAQKELLTTFVTAFTATWKARTVCAPRYDWFSDCSNWDGTEVKP